MKPVKKQKTKCDGCGRDFIEREMIVQIGLQVFCGDCKDFLKIAEDFNRSVDELNENLAKLKANGLIEENKRLKRKLSIYLGSRVCPVCAAVLPDVV